MQEIQGNPRRSKIRLKMTIIYCYHAMPSALEGTINDEPVAFSELLAAASVLIIFYNLAFTERSKCGLNFADNNVSLLDGENTE